MTTRVNFQKELEILNKSLEDMAGLVENNIEKSLVSFEKRNVELAEEIVHGDRAVDDMQRSIEAQCLSLMLHQQPVVARDLRLVSSALKIVTDLERIGDHAQDIAELVLRITDANVAYNVGHIIEMAAKAKAMMKQAIQAYIHRDTKLAAQVAASDDEVDELFNQVKNEISVLLRKGKESVDDCVDVLMIAKYLERIGDHASNICEWTEFNETGTVKNIRLI